MASDVAESLRSRATWAITLRGRAPQAMAWLICDHIPGFISVKPRCANGVSIPDSEMCHVYVLHKSFPVEKRQVFAVARSLHFRFGNEPERGAVDAISQSAFLTRSVGKHMPEMGVSGSTPYLHTPHPVGGVDMFSQHFRRYRAAERRPSTPGVKLVGRHKQRLAGRDINIYSPPEFAVIFIDIRRLCRSLLRHGILPGGQSATQLPVRRLSIAQSLTRTILGQSLWIRILCVCGKFHQLRTDMAVAARIIPQILLMIIFRRIKIFQRLCLYYYRLRVVSAFPVYRPVDDGAVSGIGIVYPGAVLCADIVTLTIQDGRVDGLEIQIDKKRERHRVRVIDLLSRLGGLGRHAAHFAI